MRSASLSVAFLTAISPASDIFNSSLFHFYRHIMTVDVNGAFAFFKRKLKRENLALDVSGMFFKRSFEDTIARNDNLNALRNLEIGLLAH